MQVYALKPYSNVMSGLRARVERGRLILDELTTLPDGTVVPTQVTNVQKLIEEHLNEIRGAWAQHFPRGSH